jgi:hypothetical protein
MSLLFILHLVHSIYVDFYQDCEKKIILKIVIALISFFERVHSN